jgi:hypothetical protein
MNQVGEERLSYARLEARYLMVVALRIEGFSREIELDVLMLEK